MGSCLGTGEKKNPGSHQAAFSLGGNDQQFIGGRFGLRLGPCGAAGSPRRPVGGKEAKSESILRWVDRPSWRGNDAENAVSVTLIGAIGADIRVFSVAESRGRRGGVRQGAG